MSDSAGSAADRLDLIVDLIARAKAGGADEADAMVYEATSMGVTWRLGKREDVERSESRDLGLRVFVGRRQAFVSSNDFARDTLDEIVARAVAMARNAPEERYAGLADPALLARTIADLDLADAARPTADQLFDRAAAAEAAALEVQGVSNSEESGASWGHVQVAFATSGGFAGSYAGTSHGVYASVLAGQGTAMERDHDQHATRHLADLEDAATIGRRAGERAVARLGPRKCKSRTAPVVFDPRVSRGLLGHLAGAVSGTAVARKTSFLRDRLGEPVFRPGIRIVDDPLRPRGMSSRPFDGEGVATAALDLVSDGVLTTWLLDSSTGRQLGLASNGRASRGTAGPPAPSTTNLYLAPGTATPDELMADIAEGLYVTELIGMGVNGVTGDYSRGAAGFWIERGRRAHPVSEITIAGNLKDMFRNLTPADDLEFRHGTNAPTVRIDGMTVAGN